MEINREELPIFFHGANKKRQHVFLIGVPIGKTSWSDTLKELVINYQHISDAVCYFKTYNEMVADVEDKVIDFLKDVFNEKER